MCCLVWLWLPDLPYMRLGAWAPSPVGQGLFMPWSWTRQRPWVNLSNPLDFQSIMLLLPTRGNQKELVKCIHSLKKHFACSAIPGQTRTLNRQACNRGLGDSGLISQWQKFGPCSWSPLWNQAGRKRGLMAHGSVLGPQQLYCTLHATPFQKKFQPEKSSAASR